MALSSACRRTEGQIKIRNKILALVGFSILCLASVDEDLNQLNELTIQHVDGEENAAVAALASDGMLTLAAKTGKIQTDIAKYHG